MRVLSIDSRFNIVLGIKINKLHSIFLLLFFSLIFNGNLIAQDIIQNNSKNSNNQNETLDVNNLDISGDIQENFYLIGPGDILELTLLDVPEYSGEYKVLNDGTIPLPLIGSVYLKNLSISQASNLIENKYRTQLLRPELHLTVKVPRPILVSLIGEIEVPGIYSLTNNEKSNLAGELQIRNDGLPTLIDAIQKAGGITQNANLENVKVSRRMPGLEKEYKRTEISLIDLIFKGDHEQNLFLFDGDIIELTKASQITENTMRIAQANLSPRVINVTVVGEVNKPGQLNLSANTPLIQAVYSAGGPIAWKANKGNITLLRVNPNGTVTKKRFKLDLNTEVSVEKNPPLKDRDIVYVQSTSFNKFNKGLSTVTEPISNIVTAITFFKLLE